MTAIKDPVCGMQAADDSHYHLEYAGHDYHFCSQHCLDKFQANPGEYIKLGAVSEINTSLPAKTDSAVKAVGIYTCPMHPEVVSKEPGSCPKCGMALEPRNGPVEDNAELDDMTRRFWFSTALALPVFVMAMVSDLAPQSIPDFVSMNSLQWLEFALSTPAVLWGGWPVFQRGWASVINRHLNMFTLIALGVGVAWTYNVVAMLLPEIFPPAMRSMGGTVPVYFEAAAVIMFDSLRALSARIQARSFPFFILPDPVLSAARMAALAPSTSRLRSPLSPRLVIFPKRILSPEVCWLWTSPSSLHSLHFT